MPTVTITHPGGATETIAETTGWQYKREIGTMDKLTIGVDRRDAQAVTLNRQEDTVELEGVTTGRLVDVQTGGATWNLVVRSFEWDGKKTAPTAGGVRKVDTDENLMLDFIGDVSSWSAGTTASFTGDLTFIFNHAFPHEAMRRIEENVPGELRWNADQTVDYVAELGADKSSSVTLSASAGNLNRAIQIEEKGTDLDVTHLRVIGAHEGEAQILTNLVPSGDSGTFTNEVTYSTSRWSDSSDTVWGRWENKDVADQATIDEEAAAIADDLTETPVEATAVVEGEDLSVGDYVQVVKADAGIDRTMRIHRITTKTTDESVAGTVDEVLLSTRTIARGSEQRRLRDIQRFNVAFQGSAVWGTIGAGIQAVDSGLNYQLPFFYPDISFEHRVELAVKSIPYRAFSSGAAATTTATATLGEYVYQNQVLQNPGSTPDAANFPTFLQHTPTSPAGSNPFEGVLMEAWIFNNTGSSETNDWEINNVTQGTTVRSGTATVANGAIFSVPDPIDAPSEMVDGDELEFRLTSGRYGTASGNPLGGIGFAIKTRTSHEHGSHTHPPDPGVTEFASETASGCDVVVGGSTTDTNIGTGEFETTVDLSGEPTQGAWNTVEVTSDSLGMLICSLGIEAYRQIGGQ